MRRAITAVVVIILGAWVAGAQQTAGKKDRANGYTTGVAQQKEHTNVITVESPQPGCYYHFVEGAKMELFCPKDIITYPYYMGIKADVEHRWVSEWKSMRCPFVLCKSLEPSIPSFKIEEATRADGKPSKVQYWQLDWCIDHGETRVIHKP